jgi:hypothetical protein
MTLKTQIASDLSVFFNTDEFGETVTLNGSSVVAVPGDPTPDESADGMVDILDIEFKASDYATITYRTDTVVVDGVTWSYPKLIRQDDYTKLVRFRHNARLKP